MAEVKRRSGRPPMSPADYEDELISLAMVQARRSLEEGTAPTSVVLHYLKLGSSRADLETERLRNENALLEAKRQNIESSGRSEKLFEEALAAFGRYSPQKTDYDD